MLLGQGKRLEGIKALVEHLEVRYLIPDFWPSLSCIPIISIPYPLLIQSDVPTSDLDCELP